MSRKKEMLMVLDTETANTVEEPLPYDIGWAICDRQGNIYETRSFIVADVFLDMRDVMSSAYYAEKIPMYWDDIKSGKRKIMTMWNIRKVMIEDMKRYNIKKVGAYNMAFDKRALNNLIRYISKSFKRWWFPFGTTYFCIWNMACEVLLDSNTYRRFCNKNGFKSECGNYQTSAEIAYRYITDKTDFVENHTGLEDVMIEVDIMAKCYKRKKKMTGAINPSCWRKVQRKS